MLCQRDFFPAPDLSLPEEIARRQTLKAKLDAAAKRLEKAAAKDHDDDRAPSPKADKQINLTDPDSAIMRKSTRHEYRQAYNAQAIVDADGSQLVLATDVYSTSNDRHGLDGLVRQLCDDVGKPETRLANAGYAGEQSVAGIEARGIEPLIAISRQQGERPYDFRPPRPVAKPPPKSPLRGAQQCWKNFKLTRQKTNTANENKPLNPSLAS